MDTPTEKLILGFKANKSNVEIHQHAAYQIVFTEDNPFQTTINNIQYDGIFGFIIKPKIAHSCICNQSILTVINVEPFSHLGKFLASKLGKNDTFILESKQDLLFFFGIKQENISIQEILNSISVENEVKPIDGRILKSIFYIQENFKTEKFSILELAQFVCLSPSRLGSLFKQQIGSSITKYLLWTRLRNAIFLILSNADKSITEIAVESGFYDSAQMNKYMYQMFGIAPSKLRQKSDLIQFLEIKHN